MAAPWLLGSSDFKHPQLQHPRVAYLSTPRHLGCAILFLSRKDKAAFIVFSPAEWLRLAMPAGAPLTASPFSAVIASYNFPSPPTPPKNQRQKQQRASDFTAARQVGKALFVPGDML